MYEFFNSLVLVSSSTIKWCIHFFKNYPKGIGCNTPIHLDNIFIDISGLTRIDIPRNAAERRVCFEKLDNFGCGSLWRIWFLSTPDLLSSSGSFAVFFLCSTHHSSPLIFHFHGRSFGKSERIDFVSYYLPYPTLVFVRKCRGNFTLDCFNIFFRLFENNCPFRRCKVWFSGALCRGRSKILCHVSPLARATAKRSRNAWIITMATAWTAS